MAALRTNASWTRFRGLVTYVHRRSKYAGASVDELKRLRELEAENALTHPGPCP